MPEIDVRLVVPTQSWFCVNAQIGGCGMDSNLRRINHLVYSQAALATCIHIRKLVPRAGLEPATIGFSIQHSTNWVTSAKIVINAVSLTLPVPALEHWIWLWLWPTWPSSYHPISLRPYSSHYPLAHGDLLSHFRVATFHFDYFGTVNAEVIKWRFTVGIKTVYYCLYAFLIYRHHLFLYVLLHKIGKGGGTRTPDLRFWRPRLYQLSYTLINWSAQRDSNPRILGCSQRPNHARTCAQKLTFTSFLTTSNWWARKDSNLRRLSRQIYSLLTLTACILTQKHFQHKQKHPVLTGCLGNEREPFWRTDILHPGLPRVGKSSVVKTIPIKSVKRVHVHLA